NPILFLHGFTRTKGDWSIMKGWFKADGWSDTSLYAYTFDNPNNCSFQEYINNANQIKQWVEEILAETGAKKIDLVGHSDGGLSSRYYIKFLGGIDRVDDYVSLGTPHHGDPIINSSCRELIPYIRSLNEGDETPGGILNDTLGIRYDPFWTKENVTYNGAHIPGNVSYTSIYSPHDGLVPDISSPLNGAHNVSVLKVTHSRLFNDWSIYTYVRTVVDDFNTTFHDRTTTITTTTSTTTATTESTPGFTLISLILVFSIAEVNLKRSRR
ncbi:MAG: esterase/lipase family protein, partial [Candidatus Hodarchaeales archaeon]